MNLDTLTGAAGDPAPAATSISYSYAVQSETEYGHLRTKWFEDEGEARAFAAKQSSRRPYRYVVFTYREDLGRPFFRVLAYYAEGEAVHEGAYLGCNCADCRASCSHAVTEARSINGRRHVVCVRCGEPDPHKGDLL